LTDTATPALTHTHTHKHTHTRTHAHTHTHTHTHNTQPLRVRAEAMSGSSGSQNVGDAINRGVAAAQGAAQKAQDALAKAAQGDLQPIKVPMPNVNVDLTQLVTYNFLVQLALTAVAWATVFATSHAAMLGGQGAAKAIAGSPPTAILLLGVLVSAYSAYQSYTYLVKVKKEGLNVLSGGAMVSQFFEHATLNFVGCGCALVALFAEVGSLVMGSVATSAAAAVKVKAKAVATGEGGRLAVEALAQASATTVLAHVVSLAFLMLMIRKVQDQSTKLLVWAEQLRKAMPGLA
jgi:hypothetical protein